MIQLPVGIDGSWNQKDLAASSILNLSYGRITLLLKFCSKIGLFHYLQLKNEFCHSVERLRIMGSLQNHESYFLSPVNKESTKEWLAWSW